MSMLSPSLSRLRVPFSKTFWSLRSKLHSAGAQPIVADASSSIRSRCLSTYYDSQSGLHLPIHDEQEIRLFLNVTNGYNSAENDGDEKSPFVPHRLSKDRLEAEEVSEKLEQLVQQGIHGVVLPPIEFPRDVRNLQTLSIIAPPNFVFLTNACGGEKSSIDANNGKSNTVDDGILKAQENSSSKPATFSKVLRYDNGNGLRDSLQRSVEKGMHTTLSVTEDTYADDDKDDIEPITLANNIAAMIDANGGCDYLWISLGQRRKEDASAISDIIVQVCEELIYLDVAGATIKSRLLVDSLNEDMLEDILFAGVNKYVIEDLSQAEMVEAAVEDQGKSLLRL
mmetsp:Transcript_137/g.392  ORF Transcript_137/g.392 Transcript_137/m.392 type:complete len:339 (-) Transcript_137:110-1126(-)